MPPMENGPSPLTQAPPEAPKQPDGRYIREFLLLSGLMLLILIILGWWLLKPAPTKPSTVLSTNSSTQSTAVANKVQGVTLDASKNYGNKYASGILPVGDSKYTTDQAKAGYIYACSGYANNLSSGQGGASSRGPWFVGTTQYNINKKAHIRGSVSWQPSFSVSVSGDKRLITTNDLPNHKTGIFPVSVTDPAYAYDHNPNSIKAQSVSYSLSANPTYGSPQCIGGQVGMMLTGVVLFDGFDAAGRDAGAWEVQDDCDGHPEKTGEYHYHTLSSCISDVSVNTVIGFALDGFPITGPEVSSGNLLTTSDLDECHGLTSQVVLDNKKVTTYHYVMTQDFPYSISCYRATPVTLTPPAGARS